LWAFIEIIVGVISICDRIVFSDLYILIGGLKQIVYTMTSSGIRLGEWDYLQCGHIKPVRMNNQIIAAKSIVYAKPLNYGITFEFAKSLENQREQIIQIRYQIEQYVIHISERDIQALNLKETFGIYKVNNSEIRILYDEQQALLDRLLLHCCLLSC
jgi:hypothetical protein